MTFQAVTAEPVPVRNLILHPVSCFVRYGTLGSQRPGTLDLVSPPLRTQPCEKSGLATNVLLPVHISSFYRVQYPEDPTYYRMYDPSGVEIIISRWSFVETLRDCSKTGISSSSDSNSICCTDSLLAQGLWVSLGGLPLPS